MRKDYEILGIDENADEKAIKRAYFKLVRTYSPEKDPERFQEIRSAYERLAEAGKQEESAINLEFPADDRFAVSMFDQIQQLMQEQAYEQALRTAEEGLRYYPDMECFLYMYAKCSILNDNSGKAVKAYQKLVQRYPGKVHYMSELAKAYYHRGYVRKAYSMFQEAYGAGARETDFLLEYGLYCFQAHKYKEALQSLGSLIDSIPPEKSAGKIPELLETYSGIFAIYLSEPFALKKYAESFRAFLEQAGKRVHDYDDMLAQLYPVIWTAAEQQGGPETEALAEQIKELLPDWASLEEPPEFPEAHKVLEDERFGDVIKIAMESFLLLDSSLEQIEDFEDYLTFMQMDAFLCLLEEWPKPRKELELLQREYPNAYELGADLWVMLKSSKGVKSSMVASLLPEYGKLERIFRCGHYYERYPDRRQNAGQVQWDSQESGTYMRQGKKVGRNDPCPCGSGKKYKNCCGRGK